MVRPGFFPTRVSEGGKSDHAKHGRRDPRVRAARQAPVCYSPPAIRSKTYPRPPPPSYPSLTGAPKRDHDEWLAGRGRWAGSRSGPGGCGYRDPDGRRIDRPATTATVAKCQGAAGSGATLGRPVPDWAQAGPCKSFIRHKFRPRWRGFVSLSRTTRSGTEPRQRRFTAAATAQQVRVAPDDLSRLDAPAGSHPATLRAAVRSSCSRKELPWPAPMNRQVPCPGPAGGARPCRRCPGRPPQPAGSSPSSSASSQSSTASRVAL
jgi:hypothetical protein